jgi:hypothetical protein
MPASIKNLLKKAGFKKKALTNRETALDIFKMLIEEVDFQSLQKAPIEKPYLDNSTNRETLNAHRGSDAGRARMGSVSSMTGPVHFNNALGQKLKSSLDKSNSKSDNQGDTTANNLFVVPPTIVPGGPSGPPPRRPPPPPPGMRPRAPGAAGPRPPP